MRKVFKVLLFIFLVTTILLGAITIYFIVSPKPSVWLVREAFSLSEYTEHENLAEIKTRVSIESDLTYTSHGLNNNYEVLIRTDLKDNLNVPTIIWVHGGAFVAGDKQDVTNYMYVLADEGYAVVNMNYALGYEQNFPTPLRQIGQLYQYLATDLTKHPYLDLDNVIFGGDSAGAFLVAQFIINNTNPDYSELTGVPSQISKEKIKGAILFCGPYDFNLLSNLVTHRFNTARFGGAMMEPVIKSAISFFSQRIGEAFLDDKEWSTNSYWNMLTLRNYVTADFPTTFITDAKNLSFETHGRGLAYELREEGVSVETVFYEAELAHEFQFNLSTINEDGKNYGMMTLESVLTFLGNLS